MIDVQPALPFEGADPESILRLDPTAMLDDSIALAGFRLGDQTGEVFEDGAVCFHDGDGGDDVHVETSFSRKSGDETLIAAIKEAHQTRISRLKLGE